MTELVQNHVFIYGIAFTVFLGIAFRFGLKPFLAWLDSGIEEIRDELDQARKLRREAEGILKEYQEKQAAALLEAQVIIKRAKEDAMRLKTQAEEDLKTALARQEQQALDRIRIAENEAQEDVRKAAIDMAIDMARKALASQVDEVAATKLIDQAIADMPRAAAKAKAA